MKYFIVLISLFFIWSSALGDDFSNAKNKYKNIPENLKDEVKWLEPYDETYLPYNFCNDPSSLKVVEIKEKVDAFWDDADGVIETITQDHGYCLFSIIKIIYNVTCLNKLEYQGAVHLFSNNKCLKSGWTHGNFSAEENEFLTNRHDWRNFPFDSLKEDGSIANYKTDFNTWKYEGFFNKQNLIEQWRRQKVLYPEWQYTGSPGKKLARPVIFVHGLNSSYDVWGVEPITETSGDKKKIEESFQKGRVKKYEYGSAPDIISRMQNIDNTESNINKNGIYFFQAPGKLVNGEWEEADLDWDNRNATNSQSRKLYQQLINVLDDFYDSDELDWRNHAELVVDIVAHSQGGLVVREMLRGLLAEGAEKSPQNAANHIELHPKKWTEKCVF